MPTILLAEDEHAIAETVLYALRAEGFAAEHVLLGGQVLPRLARGGPYRSWYLPRQRPHRAR